MLQHRLRLLLPFHLWHGLVSGLALFAILAAPAGACPLCLQVGLTWSERVDGADAAVLVQWVSGVQPWTHSAGSTTYEVTEGIKGLPKLIQVKSRITLDRFRAGQPGDLSLLLGHLTDAKTSDRKQSDTKTDSRQPKLIWEPGAEVTEVSFQYLTKAPARDQAASDRLAYFARFLESPDPLIGNDAFGEFANAPYQDVAAAADQFPRDKLRKWIVDPQTPATRLGLYGLMLGLCGDASDAKTLEALIVKETDGYRLGGDGLIGGYLLLTREAGLAVIDREKFLNENIPLTETFSAMQALRFMWTYGGERISAERLRQSMRLLLDRPELADLVIADLARWNDWAIQADLMKRYGAGDFNTPSIKRAIIRFLLVCSKDSEEAGEMPAHVLAAKQGLADLRKRDPKIVADAERYFILN